MSGQRYSSQRISNTYSSIYEQYYFENDSRYKVRPIRKKVKKRVKKNSFLKKIFSCLILSSILFFLCNYSFKNFIADTVNIPYKDILKADYYSVLYPTHTYLYKNLFLGKYPIKDSVYENPIMIDIKESFQRKALKNRLLQLASDYSKISPSIYVWEYDGSTYVDINADVPFPAASIIKVPVLIEMFRAIEQGKFTLEDTMVLEDYYRAAGSGGLQYSQGGVAHSMDYLAKIMIENSDNSSTNMIISKLGGMPEVNKAIKSWGLKTTQINNWLPDMGGTNLTTAREMAKMFYNMDSTTLLSNSSKRHIAGYLSNVRNNRLLKAGLPKQAILLHKTGDIGFMVGDAGIVKTANGKKYIVVIMVKRPYNHLQGKEFIVKASKLIYNNISL